MPNFKKGKSFAENFNAKTPFRKEESIMGKFMAMGRALGNSKTPDVVSVDPSKYYKPPAKKENKAEVKPETAVNKVKRLKAEKELKELEGSNFKFGEGVTLNTKKKGGTGTNINQKF